MLSGNSAPQRQERLAKLEIDVREFQAAEIIAKRNLDIIERQATKELLVIIMKMSSFDFLKAEFQRRILSTIFFSNMFLNFADDFFRFQINPLI